MCIRDRDMASLLEKKEEAKGPELTQGSEKDAAQADQATTDSTEEKSSGDMPVMVLVLLLIAGGAYFFTRKKDQ